MAVFDKRILLQGATHVQGFSQASPADQPVFIAPFDLTLKAIYEAHATAGSDAGAVTLQIERLQGTEAIGSGDNVLTTAFNMKATADTVQTGVLTVTTMSQGDRLALNYTGTLTDLANVAVTIKYEDQ